MVIGLKGLGLPGGRQLPVRAVQGIWVVANTIPGRMLPTGEPMPGNNDAAPCEPPPPVAGPIWALKPGKPNNEPIGPAVNPNVPAEPPIYGKPTKG